MTNEVLFKIKKLFLTSDAEFNKHVRLYENVIWINDHVCIYIKNNRLKIYFSEDLVAQSAASIMKKLIMNDIIPFIFKTFYYDEKGSIHFADIDDEVLFSSKG